MAPNTTPTIGRRDTGRPCIRAGSTDISDDESTSTRHSNSALRMTAIEIAEYVFRRRTGRSTKRSIYGETMHKLCDEMVSKHKFFFQGLGQKLKLSPDDVIETYISVSSQIFSTGFNFGRLVSLYSWTIYVLEYCSEQGLEEEETKIISLTADCIERFKDVFEELGGWDGFKSHFSDSKDTLWQGLMFTTFSLGALAAFFYVKS